MKNATIKFILLSSKKCWKLKKSAVPPPKFLIVLIMWICVLQLTPNLQLRAHSLCKGCRKKNVPFFNLPIARVLANQMIYVIAHFFRLFFIFQKILIYFFCHKYFLRYLQICLMIQTTGITSSLVLVSFTLGAESSICIGFL